MSATREAVAVTRCRGRNASRTITVPSRPATSSATAASAVIASVTLVRVLRTSLSEKPLTSTSPSGIWLATTR